MKRTRSTRFLIILFTVTLLLGSAIVAQALPPRSVGLVSFDATALTNGARLEWETATELETAGYIVKRSVNGGSFISLPDIGEPGYTDTDGNPAGFILAEGGPAEGAEYQEVDDTAQGGNTYAYMLVEIEYSGSEVELDTAVVTLAEPPTSTHTATPTAQPTATNMAVPTTASTSAPAVTNTAQPVVVATATATPTRQATATATTAAATPTATMRATAVPTSLPPTATPTAQQVAVSETSGQEGDQNPASSSGNVVFAQEGEPTATAVPSTPAPENTDTEAGYPATQNQAEPETNVQNDLASPTPISLEATPYPAAPTTAPEEGGNGTPVVPVIGSQDSNQEEANAANATPSSQNREAQLGRLYLWGGFVLSLLIFITTVVATILLFTRKRSP